MATGDQSDILARLKSVLPARWFGDVAPIRDALLTGWANAHAFLYSLYSYAKNQTRILTASDGWLDLIAGDFFGAVITRTSGQSDASLRGRILANLFREKATRRAIAQVLQDLTGRTPTIIEPQRPADTGAYSAPNSGYAVAGAYGSVLLPYQAFVVAYRPAGSGIPNVAGYGISTAGYGVGSQAEYADLSMVQGAVQDADIYAAIDSVKPAATTLWTRIDSNPPAPYGHIGVDFVIGTSALAP